MRKHYLNWALGASAVVFTLSAILLYKGGIFVAGSVNQVHSVCQEFGPVVYLAGQQAANDCSNAASGFYALFALLVVSLLTGIGSAVALLALKSKSTPKPPRANDVDGLRDGE